MADERSMAKTTQYCEPIILQLKTFKKVGTLSITCEDRVSFNLRRLSYRKLTEENG